MASDQAPHWEKKEEKIGVREKEKNRRAKFFFPLANIFPISPFFPTEEPGPRLRARRRDS